MAFSLDSKVKDILKNPEAAAVLDKYSPDASKNPQMKLVGGLTLRKLASFPQSAFLKPHLEELEKEWNEVRVCFRLLQCRRARIVTKRMLDGSVKRYTEVRKAGG